MHRILFFPIFVLLAALVTGLVVADDDHLNARRLLSEGEIQPLDVILEKVQQHQTGRLLEAELESEAGMHIYEIELLDSQGVVWELKIDARTGELLGKELED